MGFKPLSQGSGSAVAGTPIGTSLAARGSVVAPAAGATIVDSGALSAGNYQVQVFFQTSSGDQDNLQLQVGATVIGPVFGTAETPPTGVYRVNVPANAHITANAIGAGTAGVTYSVVIIWTPVA